MGDRYVLRAEARRTGGRMFRRMSPPPPAKAHSHLKRRRDFNLRRYMQIGLTFASVFTLAVVVGWLVWPDGDGKPQAPPAVPSDPAITAFYEAEGAVIMDRWGTLSPALIDDIAEGGTCLPSVLVHAASCPAIHGLLEQRIADLESLMDYTRTTTPPAGVAAEWVASQLMAWNRLLPSVQTFARVAGIDFADEAGWESAHEELDQATMLQTAAEKKKFAMLMLVDRSALSAGVTGTKGGGQPSRAGVS